MTHEQRFRWICQGLLAIGVVPTPTKLNRFLRRQRSRSNSINGREATWRRQELLAAGYAEPRWVGNDWNGHWTRWEKPA